MNFKLHDEAGIREMLLSLWPKRNGIKQILIKIKETIPIFKALGISLTKSQIKLELSKLQKDKDDMVYFESFSKILISMIEWDELRIIYNILSKNSGKTTTISEQMFLYFLKNVQNDIKSNLILTSALKDKKYINYHDFISYLYDKGNDIAKQRLIDDNHPITHYYISSSHNTYLSGHQLAGESTTDMYRDVLLEGCRCVELDCWDGPKPASTNKEKDGPKPASTNKEKDGPKPASTNKGKNWSSPYASFDPIHKPDMEKESENTGEPIIYHGHTLTSKILFKDVLATIKKYGFINSPYPIILSIENHCSIPYQNKMAVYFKLYLGSSVLMYDDIKDDLNVIPLRELKYKIIIKGKILTDERNHRLEAGIVVSAHKEAGTVVSAHKEKSSLSQSTTLLTLEQKKALLKKLKKEIKEETKDINRKAAGLQVNPKIPQSPNIATSLSDLTYLSTTHSFESEADPFQILSVDENKIQTFISKHTDSKKEYPTLPKYSLGNLIRIYPKNFRVDSSNYDPTIPWDLGCQIVALNWQTPGKEMWINQGMFQSHGKAGYILKPDYLRFNLDKEITPKPMTLTIQIYSGRFLAPKQKPISPYVQISVVSTGYTKRTFKTKTIKDNGLNPSWNEKYSTILGFSNKDHLLFEIVDLSKGFFGTTILQKAVRIADLKTGYRIVHLERSKITPIVNKETIFDPTLLVKLNIYKPD